MKNKKVKILSGICSALVAFGAVLPCGVNATEPTASMPGLTGLSSSFSDTDYSSYIQDATAEEIFYEIKSRRAIQLSAKDFFNSLLKNKDKKIKENDIVKLASYFTLVKLLRKYGVSLSGERDLSWDLYCQDEEEYNLFEFCSTIINILDKSGYCETYDMYRDSFGVLYVGRTKKVYESFCRLCAVMCYVCESEYDYSEMCEKIGGSLSSLLEVLQNINEI